MVTNRMINIGWGVLACLSFIVLIPGVWLVNLFTSRGPLFISRKGWGAMAESFIF
jgi:hypothetical protein